jgi:hypothetical protein
MGGGATNFLNGPAGSFKILDFKWLSINIPLTCQPDMIIKRKYRVRRCQSVNNQFEPFLKGDAMERLLKPRLLKI